MLAKGIQTCFPNGCQAGAKMEHKIRLTFSKGPKGEPKGRQKGQKGRKKHAKHETKKEKHWRSGGRNARGQP